MVAIAVVSTNFHIVFLLLTDSGCLEKYLFSWTYGMTECFLLFLKLKKMQQKENMFQSKTFFIS